MESLVNPAPDGGPLPPAAPAREGGAPNPAPERAPSPPRIAGASASPGPAAGMFRIAAIAGVTGVCLGAFGAHALRDRVTPDLLEIYRTGVLYHLVHAVALLALAAATRAGLVRWPRLSAGLFAVGIVVFSGSLYLLAVTGVRVLGAITPLGGLAFIAGWTSLLWRPRRALGDS